MGLLGLIIFSLKCLDIVAWPLCAFGYPLCASILAIETSSKRHMRKLVTYWTLFALISLFDLAFMRLIDWVPFWPYLKLILICLLVIPHFTGACYVYQRLVHPCLYVDLQVVMSRLCNPKEGLSVEKDTFLAVAERYLQENGSDALEKLIASKSLDGKSSLDVEEIKAIENAEKEEPAVIKQLKYVEPDISRNDVKPVEPTKENTVVAAKRVKPVMEIISQMETNKKPTAKFKEMTLTAAGEEYKLLETPALKQVQNDWTCDLCQVTTSSETTMNCHFQERKHKNKCEVLKANKSAAAKNMDSALSLESKINQANTGCKKYATGNVQPETKTRKQDEKQVSDEFSSQQLSPTAKFKEMTLTAAGEDYKLLETSALKQVQNEWTCALCQVATFSETIMNCHFQGRKHKKKCEALKANKLATAENMDSAPSSESKINQVNTGCKKSATGNAQPQTKTRKQDEKQMSNAVNSQHLSPTAKLKEMTLTAAGEEYKLIETPALKQVQNEWTCALCQVTTGSETTLNCHFQGRKHKKKCEALKANKLAAAKNMDFVPSSESKINQANKGYKNYAIGNAQLQAKTRELDEKQPSNVVSGQQLSPTAKFKETTLAAAGEDCVLLATPAFKQVQSKWTCALCKVNATSETTLNCHFQGRKHKNNCEALKANKLAVAKNMDSPQFSESKINKANTGCKKSANWECTTSG